MNNNPLPRQRARSPGTSPGLTSKSETAHEELTMKTLYVTEDMKRWQEMARCIWRERKVIDVGKVVLGWNLRKGTVIVDTAKNVEIELMDNPASYPDATPFDVTMVVNSESKSGKMSKQLLAKIIMVQPCEVYYSR